MAWTYFPRGTEPKPLDIVWCAFPYVENPHSPAPDQHPCVVKQSFVDQDGNPWLRVVYGTSQQVHRAGTYEIPQSENTALGLNPAKQTTICLWRVYDVPYSSEFFPLLSGRGLPTAYPMSPDRGRDFAWEASRYDMNEQPTVGTIPPTPLPGSDVVGAGE